MNEIIMNVTLGFVFVLCAVAVICILPLEKIFKGKEKKDAKKRDEK